MLCSILFLFLLVSGVGCGLLLWLSLDFSINFFFPKRPFIMTWPRLRWQNIELCPRPLRMSAATCASLAITASSFRTCRNSKASERPSGRSSDKSQSQEEVKQVAQRASIAHLSPMCQGQIFFHKTYKWAMETRGPKTNSSELLCLSWLPETLMMIRSKMNELAWRHHFPVISLWNFFRPQGQPKFEHVRDFMYVLVTCKYRKDRIRNNREKVETSFSPL